jgi:hypothetical protein
VGAAVTLGAAVVIAVGEGVAPVVGAAVRAGEGLVVGALAEHAATRSRDTISERSMSTS